MDTIIAFLIFMLLLVGENLAAINWFPPYFWIGIPVYGSKHKLHNRILPENAVQILEKTFQNSVQHPSLKFKQIAPNQIALREALFENRPGPKYLPIMHSRIRLHPTSGEFTITGVLNWYVLGVLIFIAYRVYNDFTFLPVALLILLIFGLSFAAQLGINQRLGRFLQDQSL